MSNSNNYEVNKITKESIVQALLILLETKEYHKITISDIAKKAGVSRNAYYRNFYEKSDVIKYYLMYKWTAFVSNLSNSEVEVTDEEFAEKIVYFIYDEKDFFLKINNAGLLYLFEKILYEIFTLSNPKSNFEMYSTYWTVYFIYGTIKGIIHNNFSDNPDELLVIILQNMKRFNGN